MFLNNLSNALSSFRYYLFAGSGDGEKTFFRYFIPEIFNKLMSNTESSSYYFLYWLIIGLIVFKITLKLFNYLRKGV